MNAFLHRRDDRRSTFGILFIVLAASAACSDTSGGDGATDAGEDAGRLGSANDAGDAPRIDGGATVADAGKDAAPVKDSGTQPVDGGGGGGRTDAGDAGAPSGTNTALAAAGNHFSCAVDLQGGVRCWGAGSRGELGNNAALRELRPVDVIGLSSGVAYISSSGFSSSGHGHSCVVLTNGAAKCWGFGYLGALGHNSSNDALVPVDVVGLGPGTTSQISIGEFSACAVTTAGGAKCWGYGDAGQVGNGLGTTTTSPKDVTGLASGVQAVSVGGYHACALTTAGGVKCWGENARGALGNGTKTNALVPVDVMGLSTGVAEISAGRYHTCARMIAGGVKCWGESDYGRLGSGSGQASDALSPVDVVGLSSSVKAIAAGFEHTCALLGTGAVQCWGINDSNELGQNGVQVSAVAIAVPSLSSGVASISSGGEHTCAVMTTGAVKCWGMNEDGELGDGTTSFKSAPVDVLGLP